MLANRTMNKMSHGDRVLFIDFFLLSLGFRGVSLMVAGQAGRLLLYGIPGTTRGP